MISYIIHLSYIIYNRSYICLFLTCFTQYDNLWSYPRCCKWHYFTLFCVWAVLRGAWSTCSGYVLWLMPVWVVSESWLLWAVLPEHWGVNVYLLRYAFVHVHHQEWDCWPYGDPIFSFLWNIYTFSTVTAPASIPASGAGGVLLFVDVYSPILGAPQVSLVAKNLPANAGDTVSISDLERSHSN